MTLWTFDFRPLRLMLRAGSSASSGHALRTSSLRLDLGLGKLTFLTINCSMKRAEKRGEKKCLRKIGILFFLY